MVVVRRKQDNVLKMQEDYLRYIGGQTKVFCGKHISCHLLLHQDCMIRLMNTSAMTFKTTTSNACGMLLSDVQIPPAVHGFAKGV